MAHRTPAPLRRRLNSPEGLPADSRERWSPQGRTGIWRSVALDPMRDRTPNLGLRNDVCRLGGNTVGGSTLDRRRTARA
jgi:hypothetical protein